MGSILERSDDDFIFCSDLSGSMVIYEGPVKLMLCFVSQVVRTAKSVGQDPNIIYGGQSVSSLTWPNFFQFLHESEDSIHCADDRMRR